MATWDQPRRAPRRLLGRWLDALFGEAWELQRRRRRRQGALGLIAVAAVVAGIVVASRPDPGHGQRSPRGTVRAAVSSHGVVDWVALAQSADYSSLALVGGRVIIWGDGQSDTYSAPEAASAKARCQVADVDTQALILTDRRSGSCADPALFGERVLLVETATRSRASGVIPELRVSAMTHGGRYRIGPVIARYEQCSSCNPVSTYGDGSLWLFVADPVGVSSTTSQLLRISERTGRVAQRWTMPVLDRPVMATDRDGLWIGPSLFSGTPYLHPTAAQVRAYQSLYRVQPGMRRPQMTYRLGNSGARWIVASGSMVWVNTGSPTQTRVTGLRGPDARPVLSSAAATAECLDMGEGPIGIGGDARAGIDCLGENGLGYPALFHYSARSGALKSTTALTRLSTFALDLPAALSGRDFFFLEPSTASGGTGMRLPAGESVLYRVSS